MSDTKTLLEALGKPFPREAVKRREGSRGKFFDYVAGHTIIHRLNHATGGRWDWEIKSFEFRPLPATAKGKEQSLVVVTGTLTIPGLGSRSGIGVQKVSEDAGEDLVKGASTDALKKAATLFGVALELYGDDYETEPVDEPSDLDANLLERIRDDTASPAFRQKALHNYYLRATEQDDLIRREAAVSQAGLPPEDLRKAYHWHNARIARESDALGQPAPVAPAHEVS